MKAPRITYHVLAAINLNGVGGAPGRKLRKGEVITVTVVRKDALEHIVQIKSTVYSLPTHALPWLREMKS